MARPVPIPQATTLADYVDGVNYVDCFACDMAKPITLPEFVAAFYQTPLFRLEALILRFAARRPSTNAEAVDLAQGARRDFAAWTQEARTDDSLLMCDMSGRTRSWFGVVPGAGGTRLLFGSVVTAVGDGERRKGVIFNVLLPFHKLYARALLWSAARRLR